MLLHNFSKLMPWLDLRPGENSKEQVRTFAKLSDFSNLSGTARYRHIQSLHENNDRRNPDILAGALMTSSEQKKCFRLNAFTLMRLRKNPYYYYLVARTKFYDQLILDTVVAGIRRILIVGAGFDTRLYRFGGHLAAHGVEIAECDQPDAVMIKKELAKSLPYSHHVQYLSADLNRQETWNDLLGWLGSNSSQPVLILAEGVSPYVENSMYMNFLAILPSLIASGSWLAYDYKQRGTADDFGTTKDTLTPFRLPLDEKFIKEQHANLGFKHASLITPLALMQAYVPSWNTETSPLFHEDAVVQARV